MFRHVTIEPRKSCSHGKNMIPKSIFGVLDVFSLKCLKEDHYSLGRIMSISSLLLRSYWELHRMMLLRRLGARILYASSGVYQKGRKSHFRRNSGTPTLLVSLLEKSFMISYRFVGEDVSVQSQITNRCDTISRT